MDHRRHRRAVYAERRTDGNDTSIGGIKETAARANAIVRPFLVRFFRGLGDSPFEERMTMLYPGGQGIA